MVCNDVSQDTRFFKGLSVIWQDAILAHKVVDGASCALVAFDHPDHDIDIRPTGRSAESIGRRAGDVHGIGQVLRRRLPPERRGTREGEKGVAWQLGLAKGSKRRALLRRGLNKPAGLLIEASRSKQIGAACTAARVNSG